MFENITNFFKKFNKVEKENSKNTAKERLHLVLAQDRANLSADFLEMMKQEIIEVIKKYISIDEEAIDVRMTNKVSEQGDRSAPSLYANIPILKIKDECKKEIVEEAFIEEEKQEDIKKDEEKTEEDLNNNEEVNKVEQNDNNQNKEEYFEENKNNEHEENQNSNNV